MDMMEQGPQRDDRGCFLKGHKMSTETRAKMSEAHKGKVFSAETRAKISAAKKGYHPVTEFPKGHRPVHTFPKGNSLFKGRKHTPEAIEKIRAANMGNTWGFPKGNTLAKGRTYTLTHGMTGTPTFHTWAGMLQRTSNPNHIGFRNYGGRGITVCDRWKDFAAFLEDMGVRPPGTSIDRIDPDGNYEPGNCRWADRKTQRINQRAMKASS